MTRPELELAGLGGVAYVALACCIGRLLRRRRR